MLGFKEIKSKLFSKDENARALQSAGIIRFILLFLQGILLVKLGFDPYTIGIIESFYFLFNLSRFYFLSGGKYSGFNEIKSPHYNFDSIFWAFHLFGLLAAGIAWVYIGVHGDNFSSFLDLPGVAILLPILLLFSLPVNTYDIFYLHKNKAKNIVTYTLIASIAQTVILLSTVVLGGHMGHVLFGLLVFFVGRWLHLMVIAQPWKSIDFSQIWSFALLAAPLIFYALFSGLMDYVDGWIIKSYYSDDMFAIYRYGAREIPLNSILISGVVGALLIKKGIGHDKLQIEMKKILRLMIPILAILILLSPLLFQFVYDENYKESALYFNMYALLILSHIVFVQVYFYRAGDRWLLFIIALAELFCNIYLSLILMKVFGIVGILLATLIIDLVFRILMMVLVALRYRILPSQYIPWKPYVLSWIVLFISFSLSYLLYF